MQPDIKDTTLPNPKQPATYPRRILVAVVGQSPQIVTETLYVLATRQQPAFIPTEVVLITTKTGRQYIRHALLEEGWFARLCEDYDLPPIPFSEDSIRVIPGENNGLADDIRNPADNERAADFIARTIRDLTNDDASALHVSIAGGRKTMGYYLGYALSLFGRIQDRLSHVLVSPPFESHRQFYYPTPYSKMISFDHKNMPPQDCRDAEVTLAEIPFVSMRHGMDQRLLAGEVSFTEAVESARHALGPARLVIDLPGRYILAGTTRVRLSPASLAMLSVFARRAKKGLPPIQAPTKGVPDQAWAEQYLEEYRLILCNPMDDHENTEKALKSGMDGEYFSEKKSNLHKVLNKRLGAAAKPYLIDNGGKRPGRFSLKLPADAIEYRSLSQ